LLATNQAMFETRGFVDTFVAKPITIWNILEFRFKAVSVVTFVTTIT